MRIVISLLVLLSAAPNVLAQTLKIGDPAPPLVLGEFIKGEAIGALPANSLSVVEFWASWCGPCRATVPHLTELAHKYSDVTMLGVNVADPEPANARAFVEQQGDKMDYLVAFDRDNTMLDTWMRAAGQSGIPTAFLVDRQGKLAWIGHPMQLEEAIVAAGDAGGGHDAIRREPTVAASAGFAAPNGSPDDDPEREAQRAAVEQTLNNYRLPAAQRLAAPRAWFAADPGAERIYWWMLWSGLHSADSSAADEYLGTIVPQLTADPLVWRTTAGYLRGIWQPTAVTLAAADDLDRRAAAALVD